MPSPSRSTSRIFGHDIAECGIQLARKGHAAKEVALREDSADDAALADEDAVRFVLLHRGDGGRNLVPRGEADRRAIRNVFGDGCVCPHG